MASVTIGEVHKSFGPTHIIKGVSVDIKDGEFCVLVGPSGCGKSTLLRMIAGLEEISGGTISIGNKVVNDMPPKERDIAMVFQNYALYPHMTVRDNMAFSLMLAKQDQQTIDASLAKAADILGLNALMDRFPRQLSGGQRQRVAMGRAIVRDSQVFLFDEPLSNLDAQLRVAMRTEIKALHQRLKTTSIYVTHDQIEAMTMADKIVVMRDGLVEQTGSPLELYDRPANQFVAGFIGSPKMNFIAARLESAGIFGVPDDPQRRAILHRLARIGKFTLAVNLATRRLARPLQQDQRGVANQFESALARQDHRHGALGKPQAPHSQRQLRCPALKQGFPAPISPAGRSRCAYRPAPRSRATGTTGANCRRGGRCCRADRPRQR